MTYQWSFFSISFIASVGIDLLVVYLMWKRREMRAALLLAGFMLAVAEWAFGAGMELAAVGFNAKIFWSKVAYIGISSAPALYFLFTLRYTNHNFWLGFRRQWALWIIPVITFGLVTVNEQHGWVWSSITPSPEAGSNILIYSHGWWYWVFVVYTYLCLLIGSLLLFRDAYRQRQVFRRQALAILLGVPLPWISNILYVLGASPLHGEDLAPVAFTFTGLFLAVGIYRFQLFDLMPVARERVFEDLRDGVIVLDMKDRIVDLNPAAKKFLGVPGAQPVGKGIQEISPILGKHVSQEEVHAEIFAGEGDPYWLDMNVSSLHDHQGFILGRLIVLHDISSLKKTESDLEIKSQELERIATVDILTEVFNRRYAQKALMQEFKLADRSNTPLAIGLCDIDLFKKVNDQYGHNCGDEVLKSVAHGLSTGLRATDVIARMGGDEFLIIFGNTNLQNAGLAMERLRRTVEKKIVGCMQSNVTISGGVAMRLPGEIPDDTLKRADQLLYKAKNVGRNRILVEETDLEEGK